MDYITKTVNSKLKDFEKFYPHQKDSLVKSSASILKSKNKLTSHGDTINKLKHASFDPVSIEKTFKLPPAHA